MSTLGRKAMKKTLERLKEDAFRKTSQCNDFIVEMINILEKESDKMDAKLEALLHLIGLRNNATISLLRYIQALEDYGYELDEEWDSLLKSIEEAQQPRDTQKKGKEKKPSYIK